jgi:hypothetical protein
MDEPAEEVKIDSRIRYLYENARRFQALPVSPEMGQARWRSV